MGCLNYETYFLVAQINKHALTIGSCEYIMFVL